MTWIGTQLEDFGEKSFRVYRDFEVWSYDAMFGRDIMSDRAKHGDFFWAIFIHSFLMHSALGLIGYLLSPHVMLLGTIYKEATDKGSILKRLIDVVSYNWLGCLGIYFIWMYLL